MRLVAVSVVKNEADLIEAFVRHSRAWVDHHLVFDHDSTDGTREILGALQREGLPITLYTDDALGHVQQARSNHLTRLAATEFGADWILPLDGDEILTGPGRRELEVHLAKLDGERPASLHHVDYCLTAEDVASEINPVLRLQYRPPAPSATIKILVPARLARDPQAIAGKGSHDMWRDGTRVPDVSLPPGFFLSHLALRSPQHQAMRLIIHETQRNARGQANAGLDFHYRLGFQTLADDPDFFLSTTLRPATALVRQPIPYLGSPLRYSGGAGGWSRVVRALLPFVDKLAASHGALVDGKPLPSGPLDASIRELPAGRIPPPDSSEASRYAGFTPVEGWGSPEGPVPEALLPVFHWSYAPATRLLVTSASGGPAYLLADMISYSEEQTIDAELNGVAVHRHVFGRVNQRERLDVPLQLRAGENTLVLRYSRCLVTPHDPRKLAVIFLRLRVNGAT